MFVKIYVDICPEYNHIVVYHIVVCIYDIYMHIYNDLLPYINIYIYIIRICACGCDGAMPQGLFNDQQGLDWNPRAVAAASAVGGPASQHQTYYAIIAVLYIVIHS